MPNTFSSLNGRWFDNTLIIVANWTDCYSLFHYDIGLKINQQTIWINLFFIKLGWIEEIQKKTSNFCRFQGIFCHYTLKSFVEKNILLTGIKTCSSYTSDSQTVDLKFILICWFRLNTFYKQVYWMIR